MNVIVASLTLALIALSSLFSDGSKRYFEVSSKTGLAPFVITLNADALKDSKNAETFIWDFGDGEKLTTNISIINHTFKKEGNYLVKLQYLKNKQDNVLKAKDGGSVKITVKPQIKTNIQPIPKLACSSNRVNNLECDTAGSIDPDGSIVNYKIDWGDSSASNFTSSGKVVHQYQVGGDKLIRLTATDDKGATTFVESTYKVKINNPPIASFNCTNTGIQIIHCENTSSDNDGSLITSKWLIDGSISFESMSIDHFFASGESHQISLTVTDDFGATNTLTKTHKVILNQPPSFDLVADVVNGYAPLLVNFKASNLIDIDGTISSSVWDFGDQSNSNLTEVAHTFQTPGNYNVVVKVKDDFGAVVSKSITIVVQNAPIVASLECSTKNLLVNCNALGSYDPQGGPLIYTFEYGDSFVETNTTGVSSHAYLNSGTYVVKLIASNGLGAFTEKQLAVMPVVPENILPVVASLTCRATEALKVLCESTVSDDDGEVVSVQYTFDDGTVKNSSPGLSVTHDFLQAGDHTVSVVAIDNSGGISQPKIEIVKVEDIVFEDGIFISGVDGIDINAKQIFGEYNFEVLKRVNGVVSSLEESEITLQETYPGIELLDNKLLVKMSDFFSVLPESITLSVVVDGENYSKNIKLNKRESRLIGSIEVGQSSYEIVNANSILKGATIRIDNNQSIESRIEIFETQLSDGIVAFNLDYNGSQPISYKLENLNNELTTAIDFSQSLSWGESFLSFFNFFNSNEIDEAVRNCSNNTDLFTNKEELKNKRMLTTLPNEELPIKYYGDVNVFNSKVDRTIKVVVNNQTVEVNVNNDSVNNRIRNVIKNNRERLAGLSFIFDFNEVNKNTNASVNFKIKDVVRVNFASDIGIKSDNVILGILLHEKEHLRQHAQLGCHFYKLSYSNNKTFLDSNAEYALSVNDANLDLRDEYLKSYDYDVRYPEYYWILRNILFNGRGLGSSSSSAYKIGMIWDHLSFDSFVNKIKVMSTSKAKESVDKRPSDFLLELYGHKDYFDFVSELMISYYYPYTTESKFSKIVSSLYYNNKPFPNVIEPSYYYIPSINEGAGIIPSVQKKIKLSPLKSELQILDLNKFAEFIPDNIRKYVRFKYLIYPSDNEAFVEGYQDVFVGFSSKGDKANRKKYTLWSGEGQEPSNNNFIFNFNSFEPESNQIQVLLSNSNTEKTVQVNTSVITEIKKNICYTSTKERGTEKLKVTFVNEGNEPVEDYFSADETHKIQATLLSGECKEFYLAYNVPYFFDFIVMPSTVQEDIVEFGIYTNWDGNFVYNFEMNNPSGLDFEADLILANTPGPGVPPYYKIKMDWREISPDTILVSPLP